MTEPAESVDRTQLLVGGAVLTEPAETAVSAESGVCADVTWLENLLQEVEQATQGGFQDAHNQGYYINEYTTKVNALGDKLMQGLKRIAQKIHAAEAD
ncbi:MAG: hypothetical protein OIF58_06940, partial [Cohaesibacter sp.]|nr:hypothetical protein [Cohaesibacter sp.]